ncbi:MAG: serine--tRNA ligase [Christensenellaceae bacterium]|nr:serine--tRNA ligase [Christensenellaceae bacterium]MBR3843041.1 serine--tRNA ligase [Christensenellaceae bacterium]
MLDIRRIRQNPEEVKAGLARRHANADIDALLAKDEERRQILQEVEQKKAKRNADSKKIPQMKKAGEDTTALMAEMRELGDEIKALDERSAALDNEINEMMLAIPNIPADTTPDGESDADNVEIRRFMEPTTFDFEAKPHWEIGDALNILDPETGASVTGARFTFYRGLGARLERSVMNFMLDTHTSRGYTEVFPPFMVHEHSMYGTGQLPKFREDMFHVEGTSYYLIPTAEVPVTNMYRNMILDGEKLPIYHTAYSACFRGEAGSAGRDTRGLIRQHQFNKVELVKFARPDNSFEELEKLTADAEEILKALKIPYRVVALCAGDIGFSSCKTYDIEVWMPSYNRYVEISSCSNFMDFQARRANIRFRDGAKGKPEYVHTLNGSGLAIGRTTAAILENYQRADGSIEVPEVLRKYMGVDVIK